MHAVLLQGDHPTLPHAELQALIDVHGGRLGDPATSRIATLDSPEPLRPMVQAWGWGEVWGQAPDDPAAIPLLAQAVARRAHGDGSAAVRAVRYGHDKSPHGQAVERQLGAALAAAGHPIDLQAPQMELFAWLGEGRIAIGELQGRRPHGFEDRTTERRAHFSPVGMHPRRAAGLVHLARVPPGGRVLDPFCGTGGIVLEAAILGFEAWGSDLDGRMVQGTLQTITDAGPRPLDATVFQADIGAVPEFVDDVQGIVTDLPYGSASSSHQEDLGRLYDRALAAFAQMLPPGGHAVVGHARPDLLRPQEHGLRVRERHSEHVHRSMTRHFAVLQN